MKILVVGGAGYIGSICAEVLLDQKHDVAIFDNLSEGHRHAVDPRAEFIEGDLADREATADALARLRPEAVMHFAANALVAESMQNPSKYFRNNIANGLNLLDAMIAAEVRSLVFSSTCATFGPPERLPIESIPMASLNWHSRKFSAGTMPFTGSGLCRFVTSMPPVHQKSSGRITASRRI